MTKQREYKGQRYVAIAQFPHIRTDGTETALTRWVSNCAGCGERFLFTTPAFATKFQPNRRCQRCKQPGCRAEGVEP